MYKKRDAVQICCFAYQTYWFFILDVLVVVASLNLEDPNIHLCNTQLQNESGILINIFSL